MRNVKLSKPATKPAAKPVTAKPATPAPVAAATPATPAAPAKPAAGITRTISTIARGACNFGALSDRDTAYLAFYAGFAKRSASGRVTVESIAAHGTRPAYTGSAKPHDAGVIQRLAKAGLVTLLNGAAEFTFTDKAKTLAAYTGARA